MKFAIVNSSELFGKCNPSKRLDASFGILLAKCNKPITSRGGLLELLTLLHQCGKESPVPSKKLLARIFRQAENHKLSYNQIVDTLCEQARFQPVTATTCSNLRLLADMLKEAHLKHITRQIAKLQKVQQVLQAN